MPPLDAELVDPIRPLTTIDLIVVHCSATPSGRWIGPEPGYPGWQPAALRIDAMHRDRGFARAPDAVAAYNPGLLHIGYHYVLDIDGRIQTGRRIGEVGAHAAGHNAHSIGICMVGGAEPAARYTAMQWGSLRRLVDTLCDYLKVTRVVGHRDLSPDANGDGVVERCEWLKTCPGFDVAAWLARKRQPLAEQVVGGLS